MRAIETVNESIRPDRMSLSDLARKHAKGFLDPIGSWLNGLGIPPNTVTLLGLAGHIVSAYFLSRGQVQLGGLIILFMAPVDALDGTMARLRGDPSDWGAFVDSVVDRYSELFLFGGMLYFFYTQENWLGAALAYLTAAGSILVSYVRARAQALGFDVQVGILTRLERYLILVPALVLNQPVIGLGILAAGTQITALQRIFAMRRQAHAQ